MVTNLQAVCKKSEQTQRDYQRGLAYIQQRQYPQAIAALEEVLRTQPNDPQAHLLLGVVYLTQGDPKAAWRQDQILQKLDPKLADQLATALNTFSFNQRPLVNSAHIFPEIRSHFQRTLSSQPDCIPAYLGLAWTFGELDYFEMAANAAEQARRLTPQIASTYDRLSAAYDQLCRYQEAHDRYQYTNHTKNFNRAKQKSYHPTVDTYKQIIRLQIAQACQQILQCTPDDAEAHFLLGAIYLTQHLNMAAQRECRQLMHLDKRLADQLFCWIDTANRNS